VPRTSDTILVNLHHGQVYFHTYIGRQGSKSAINSLRKTIKITATL
jgi:hypothetical protein